MFKRVKRIRSHTDKARFYASVEATEAGFIPRQADIPSPYAYSPVWTVEMHDKYGPVVIRETSHKCFDVFAVPPEMIKGSEEEAMKDFLTITG